MDQDSERAFERFVAAEGPSLLGFAYLLTGSREAGEDLLQSALERCYRHWHRVQRSEQPGRYVRRAVANGAVDRWRLARRRPEAPLTEAAEPAVADGAEALLDRDELVRALRVLSQRQRVVVVLRYVEDLSEAETAALLDCSVGSVKSHASRGLARLRALLGEPPQPDQRASYDGDTPGVRGGRHG
ncbi:MAG TPA: SigE family RNA polymerase sigma factor [Mycobacteriales bacterium]|jgi:RNA polymerase sigma-70 factor (sigma-E family)